MAIRFQSWKFPRTLSLKYSPAPYISWPNLPNELSPKCPQGLKDFAPLKKENSIDPSAHPRVKGGSPKPRASRFLSCLSRSQDEPQANRCWQPGSFSRVEAMVWARGLSYPKNKDLTPTAWHTAYPKIKDLTPILKTHWHTDVQIIFFG